MHGSVFLVSKHDLEGIYLIWYVRVTGQLVAGFPFVIHDSVQALPLLTSTRSGLVGFDLSPVLTLCLFNGSSEVIAGFLISVRISVLLLESADVAFIPCLFFGICT
jgi:hypothetical protein